jgi:hypothetical protein
MDGRDFEFLLQIAAEQHARGALADDATLVSMACEMASLHYGAVDAAGDQVLERVLAECDTSVDRGESATAALKAAPGRGRSALRGERRGGGQRVERFPLKRRMRVAVIGAALALAAVWSLPTERGNEANSEVGASGVHRAFDELAAELGGAPVMKQNENTPSLGVFNEAAAGIQAWAYGYEGKSLLGRESWATMGKIPSPTATPVRVLVRTQDGENVGLKLMTLYPENDASSLRTAADAITKNLLAWAARERVQISWTCPPVGKNGVKYDGTYTWPREVRMCPGRTGLSQASLVAHELAHHSQGKRNRLGRASREKEDEADAVSIVALKVLLGSGAISAKDGGYLSVPGKHLPALVTSRSAIEEMATELVSAGSTGSER